MKELRSHNGSNFVGSDWEIKEAIEQIVSGRRVAAARL